MEDLPIKERDRVYPRVFIDATPDGGYALRILRYWREQCNTKWELVGADVKLNALYELMNEHQDQRAKELDAAIAKLMKQ